MIAGVTLLTSLWKHNAECTQGPSAGISNIFHRCFLLWLYVNTQVYYISPLLKTLHYRVDKMTSVGRKGSISACVASLVERKLS